MLLYLTRDAGKFRGKLKRFELSDSNRSKLISSELSTHKRTWYFYYAVFHGEEWSSVFELFRQIENRRGQIENFGGNWNAIFLESKCRWRWWEHVRYSFEQKERWVKRRPNDEDRTGIFPTFRWDARRHSSPDFPWRPYFIQNYRWSTSSWFIASSVRCSVDRANTVTFGIRRGHTANISTRVERASAYKLLLTSVTDWKILGSFQQPLSVI